MAEAILRGVLDARLAGGGDVCVGEPRAERREYLTQQFGVRSDQDNQVAAQGADLVVLAIKPQDLPSVFKQLHQKLDPGQTALSIVAGAKMSTLTQGRGQPSIGRGVRNTPAQIGEGLRVGT